MKRKLTLIALGLLCAIPAFGQTQLQNYGYVTKRAVGVTNAEIIFPANTDKIMRLVSYDLEGDNTASIVKLQAGTYSTTVSNAAASTLTNFTVLGNLYIVATDTLVFQKADNTVFSGVVYSTNANTINLTGQLGTALAVGDRVYRMGLTVTNEIGVATVRKDGTAIFAAPLRMPIRLLSFSSGTNTAIHSATVHYDAND